LGIDFHAANGKAQHAPMIGPVFSFWVWCGVGGFIFGFLFLHGRSWVRLLLLQCKTLAQNKNRISYSVYFEKLKNIETGLHGFLQNCARPKKVCKKTSETSVRQSSLGGV